MVISGIELWQWRESARAQAIRAGVPPEELDWLLQEVAGLDRLALRLGSYKTRSQLPIDYSLAQLNELWRARLEEHRPVQYLVGVTPWRNFSVRVSPEVLIPRPETEYSIDLVARAIAHSPRPQEELAAGHWADLGTGSGAIALGMADLLTNATIHAVDVSESALAIARDNARRAGLGDRILFYCGSWFEPLASVRGQLSGIVSNPPYIPSAQIAELQPEVAEHEPRQALDGGADGLDCIRAIVAGAPAYLVPGGVLLFEMMAGQASSVRHLLEAEGSYTGIEIFSDLAGIERFALAYRR